MDKSPDAFRTISEVADVLDTPAHVLRFWESRFPQIRPVKRAGGRRYYRPADVALLLGIKHLLHEQGMTIRGVQKVLREQGVRHVSGLSGQEVIEEGDNASAALEAALAANFGLPDESAPLPQDQIETAQIVALEDALRARQPAAPQVPLDEIGEDKGEDLFRAAMSDAASADAQAEATVAEVLALFDEPDALPHEAARVAAEAGVAEVASSDAPEAPMLDLTGEDWPEEEGEPEDAGPATPADPTVEASDDLTAAVQGTDALPAASAASLPADPAAPLLTRLRALPRGSLATPEARLLRDRLALLADRLALPPPQLPL